MFYSTAKFNTQNSFLPCIQCKDVTIRITLFKFHKTERDRIFDMFSRNIEEILEKNKKLWSKFYQILNLEEKLLLPYSYLRAS